MCVCAFVFRSELLSGDATLESQSELLQQKDTRIVDLEHRIHELLTSLEATESRCRFVETFDRVSDTGFAIRPWSSRVDHGYGKYFRFDRDHATFPSVV